MFGYAHGARSGSDDVQAPPLPTINFECKDNPSETGTISHSDNESDFRSPVYRLTDPFGTFTGKVPIDSVNNHVVQKMKSEERAHSGPTQNVLKRLSSPERGGSPGEVTRLVSSGEENSLQESGKEMSPVLKSRSYSKPVTLTANARHFENTKYQVGKSLSNVAKNGGSQTNPAVDPNLQPISEDTILSSSTTAAAVHKNEVEEHVHSSQSGKIRNDPWQPPTTTTESESINKSEISSEDGQDSDYMSFDVPCEEDFRYNVQDSELVSGEVLKRVTSRPYFNLLPTDAGDSNEERRGSYDYEKQSAGAVLAHSLISPPTSRQLEESVMNRRKVETEVAVHVNQTTTPGWEIGSDSPDFRGLAGSQMQSTLMPILQNSSSFPQTSAVKENSVVSSGMEHHASTPDQSPAMDQITKEVSTKVNIHKVKSQEQIISPEGQYEGQCIDALRIQMKETVSTAQSTTEQCQLEDESPEEYILSRKIGAPLRFARIFEENPNQRGVDDEKKNLTSLDVRPNLFTMSGYETQVSTPQSGRSFLSAGSEIFPPPSQNTQYSFPGKKLPVETESIGHQNASNQACPAQTDNYGVEVAKNGCGKNNIQASNAIGYVSKEDLFQSEDESSRAREASVHQIKIGGSRGNRSSGENGTKRGVDLPDSDEIAGQAIDGLEKEQYSIPHTALHPTPHPTPHPSPYPAPQPALAAVTSLPESHFSPLDDRCSHYSREFIPGKTLAEEQSANTVAKAMNDKTHSKNGEAESQTKAQVIVMTAAGEVGGRKDTGQRNDRAGNADMNGTKKRPLANSSSNRQAEPRLPVRRLMSFSRGGNGDAGADIGSESLSVQGSHGNDEKKFAEREIENKDPPDNPRATGSGEHDRAQIGENDRVYKVKEDRGRGIVPLSSRDRTPSRDRTFSETRKVPGCPPLKESLASKVLRTLSFNTASKHEIPITTSTSEKPADPQTQGFGEFPRAASASKNDVKEEKRVRNPLRMFSRLKSNILSRSSSMTNKAANESNNGHQQSSNNTAVVQNLPEEAFEQDDRPGMTALPKDRNPVEVKKVPGPVHHQAGYSGGIRRLLSRDTSKDRKTSAAVEREQKMPNTKGVRSSGGSRSKDWEDGK